MESLGYTVVEIAVVTFAIWLAIKLVDPGNPANSPGVAVVFAALIVVSSQVLFWVSFLPLVVFLWALIRFYDLAIWRSLVVLLAVVAADVAFAVFMDG